MPDMDRAAFERETTLHRRVYEKLRDQIQRDCAGKYVVLAQGCLLAVADNFDQASAAVRRLQPVPEYALIFPADMDPPFELGLDL